MVDRSAPLPLALAALQAACNRAGVCGKVTLTVERFDDWMAMVKALQGEHMWCGIGLGYQAANPASLDDPAETLRGAMG